MQGFRSAEEVQRFSDMMDEMCYIVATKHSGSLKVRGTNFCESMSPSGLNRYQLLMIGARAVSAGRCQPLAAT